MVSLRIPALATVMFTILTAPAVGALEASVSGGPQAAQAAVSSINSKLDTSIAALQAQITGMTYCSKIRKFYAPADPKKDANGCVGTGDYDLNMTSGSSVNLANGRVASHNTASNDWGGLFYGPSNYGGVYGDAGYYGVFGRATGNGYGVYAEANANGGVGVRAVGKYIAVYGTSTDSWAGYFGGSNYGGAVGQGASYGLYGTATGNGYGVYGVATNDAGGIGGSFSGYNSGVRAYGNTYGLYGESSSYGVYGTSPSNYGVYGNSSSGYGVRGSSSSSWGGVFSGSNYGVYGSGATYAVYADGPLCLYGSCITSWAQTSRFGGTYTYNNGGYCYRGNPQTGGCSCPSGYSSYFATGGFNHLDLYTCEK